MKKHFVKKGYMQIALWFITLPALFYALSLAGDTPKRTLMKESFSLLVILGVSLMVAQFFLTRGHRRLLQDCPMAGVIRTHKILCYLFIPVLLLHPVLIVVPRFFEAGISPLDAFFTMVTTFQSKGILVGMCAWLLILLLAVSSMFRKQLFKKHTTWRTFHAVLSVLFIVCALWHAVDLGRHMTLILSAYLIAGAAGGILSLMKTYLPAHKVKVLKKQEVTV